jgi:pimeloyl-ACP methyl ester carboxylesterase
LTPEVIERAWRRAQNDLGRLTRNTVHVIARGSSHYVMLTQPDLIIDQLRRVVRVVRHTGR